MAWGTCFCPDFRVASIVGAAAGSTATNDRRLCEEVGTTVPTFVIDAIDTGRYVARANPSAAASYISLSTMTASSRYGGALFRFRYSQVTLTNVQICVFIMTTVGDNIMVRMANTGELQYSFDSAASWAGTGFIMAANTTYRFEVFVDCGTGTTHTLRIRVDGTEVANATGGTTAVTLTNNAIRFGANSSSASANSLDYSDLVTYNDPAQYGTVLDWRVMGVVPTSDGTHNQTAGDFTNQSSTSLNGSTTAWQLVDDMPPATADFEQQVVTRTTSYMEHVFASTGTSVAAGTFGDPLLVRLCAGMHPVGAQTANSVAFRLRALNADGTTSAEAAIDTSIATNTLEYRAHTYAARPVTAAAWQIGDVTSTPLRVRFGFSGDASPPPALDGVMAMVFMPIQPISPPYVRSDNKGSARALLRR